MWYHRVRELRGGTVSWAAFMNPDCSNSSLGGMAFKHICETYNLRSTSISFEVSLYTSVFLGRVFFRDFS